MKKLLGCFLPVFISLTLSAQSKQFDTTALLILDRMADVIGALRSCSFKLNTANDYADSSFGLRKEFSDYSVYMSGPDKMLINAHGHKGHRQYMYDGRQIAYYSFDENNYGLIPAPDNIVKMIDSVHTHYDVEFPAADFFYPAFTDDLMEDADIIRFNGIVTVGGKEYFDVQASGREKNFEFWISNDAYTLPSRFVITYKTQKGSPQYLASFSDWEINPDLPAAMFSFLPPPNAHEIRIMSQNDQ